MDLTSAAPSALAASCNEAACAEDIAMVAANVRPRRVVFVICIGFLALV